jgi:hypothetical protein
MNRKLIYTFTSIAFFMMWGVFGFAAATPRGESSIRPAFSSAETTSVVSEGADSRMIPVPGSQQLGWRILLVYGLIGLATLSLILSLLNAANKSTALYVQRKEHSADETQKK